MNVWTIHHCEGLFCIYSEGSVACWLLGGGSCWFFFPATFKAGGEARGSHWSSWKSEKMVLSARWVGEVGTFSPLDCHEWCSLTVLGQEGWPIILPSLPALHLDLIKYTADDVSLPPGSLSFPLGTKHPGRRSWPLKSKDPSFVCSEVIKINLPKHLQMQIKPSAD